MPILDTYARALDDLDAAHLRRVRRTVEAMRGVRLTHGGRELLAFCSNDYLGLAQHPALIDAARAGASQWGTGATASSIVCGHTASAQALEDELAQFMSLPRALYFHGGYAANVGIVPALVGPGDAVYSDALNHACLIDGARLSRANVKVYPHGDVARLEQLLANSTAVRKLVLSDAVFSMDGDLAPLPALLAACEAHDALLLVDDAHGFGVLGPGGRGTAAHYGLRSPNLLVMATLSKAAGVAGAFVAGEAVLIEWLMQRARSGIYATAAPPMITEALRASLAIIDSDAWRRERLVALTQQLRDGLAETPALAALLLSSPTPIQPLVIGDNALTLAAMRSLWQQGLWVPAIRPPTVPAGRARLRVSLSAAHAPDDVARLVTALQSSVDTGQPRA